MGSLALIVILLILLTLTYVLYLSYPNSNKHEHLMPHGGHGGGGFSHSGVSGGGSGFSHSGASGGGSHSPSGGFHPPGGGSHGSHGGSYHGPRRPLPIANPPLRTPSGGGGWWRNWFWNKYPWRNPPGYIGTWSADWYPMWYYDYGFYPWWYRDNGIQPCEETGYATPCYITEDSSPPPCHAVNNQRPCLLD